MTAPRRTRDVITVTRHGRGARPRLPRSLDPLPAETLAGFVLRLAHRLDLAPARVCTLTGVGHTGGGGLRSTMLFGLSAPATAAFAAVTALTDAEVTAMTLAPFTLGPPPTPAQRSPATAGQGLLWPQRWLLGDFTRYCPDCLTGDGSLIQDRHSGAWQTWWRLGLGFACPAHQRLLEHTCPGCGLPVQRRDGAGHVLGLPACTGLHPARCRNRIRGHHQRHRSADNDAQVCGHRLDLAGPVAVTARTDQLRLQQHIRSAYTTVLAGPHQDHAVTAATDYLRDLRVLATMVAVSWPAARDLAATTADAVLVDQHAEALARHAAGLRTQRRRVMPAIIGDRPPEPAATTAALVAVADTLARLDDPIECRRHLRAILTASPSLRPWLRRRLGEPAFTSPRLRLTAGLEAGAADVIAALQPAAPRRRPARPVRFTIDHVPQLPPPQWLELFADFLTDPPPVAVRLLRRAITVCVAQHAIGGSVADAGTALGMPCDCATTAVRTVRQRLDTRAPAFAAAVDALAAHLDAASHRIDYGRRRRAMAGWSLTPPAWQQIAADLKARTPPAVLAVIDLGDTTRELATVRVWAQATGGDYVFAPLLRPDPTRPAGTNPRAGEIQHRWSTLTHNPRGHYARLRDLLDAHARQITARIDDHQDLTPPP